jgi:hypothetical protein
MIRHVLPAIQPAKTVSLVIAALVLGAGQADATTAERWPTPLSSVRTRLNIAPAIVPTLPYHEARHTAQPHQKPKTP